MKASLFGLCLFAATAAVSACACADSPTTAPTDSQTIRVAIYDDNGAPDKGAANVQHCLAAAASPHYQIQRVLGQDIRDGALDHFDVAVFPGGSGSGQAKSLQDAGRDKTQQFVAKGGGYLGICGGAYLGTSFYPWSLHILNAKVVDREHWNRGEGTVKLLLTPLGEKFFDEEKDSVDCIYHQGPLLSPDDKPELPAYEPLATFGTEVALNGAPHGVMIGTTALARGSYQKGRVILISPHPERSAGLDGWVRRAVDWLGSPSR